ncbi:bifunctional 2-polyprenyl-6-hydroxyphenol methylase/3-demethylubiquinol 3-O-methyltransferase UbiG [uncultured Roseobacter sp.]|uniref:class I SAM-dependent methyltransferase n=1 Tax=uncultured Roseobacter sp. TaxID=114847 RepID=UPI002606E368|nr:class I SAM-dependent methyltransferase [uncultured Roseobacter sp.]
MPLVDRKFVEDLIEWPDARTNVAGKSTTSATHTDGLPIYVDFANSVIDIEDLRGEDAGQIERRSYSGIISRLKRLVSPIKKSTVENSENFIEALKALNPEPVVLVIGGGTVGQGMDVVYEDPAIKLVAFDIYPSSNIHFVADAHNIPIQSDTFDGVVVQAVLEHVLRPEVVVEEIWRVLKPEGLVYAETPFMQQVHEGPYDFTRFTESGHRYLFRRFHRVKSGSSGGPGTQMIWSIDYLFRGLFRSRKAGSLAKLAFFWLRYLDHLIPESYAVDGASGVFFLGRKASNTVSAKEIIADYRGAQ